MNINTKQQKLIEKYLDNNLSKIQSQEFEIELKSKEFREQLLFQARLMDTYKKIGIENLRNQINSLAVNKKKKIINKRTLFLLFGILALTICSIIVYNFFQSNSNNDQLYAQYFKSLPPEVSNRGERTRATIEYQQAMQLYVNKEYSAALSAFDKLDQNTESISLYKAMCQMELGNGQSAKENLTTLLTSTDQRIKQNAEWYLILLAVREGNGTSAKMMINELLKNDEHLFEELASKLMKEL